MSRHCAVAAAAILSAVVVSAQTPAPVSQPAPGKPGTGVIAGQLVDGSSGAPVTSAAVTLWPPNAPMSLSGDGTPLPNLITPAGAPQPLRTFVDASGHFVFHSLPSGAYSLSAARPGYLDTFLGQTQPKAQPGGGRHLQLADGARVTDVTLRIWKLGAIAGTVVDEAGDPSVGTAVRLLTTGSASTRPYRMHQTVETDDRGVFRFGALPPGDYIVSVPSTLTSAPADVVNAFVEELAAGPRAPAPVRDAVASSGLNLTSSGIRIGDSVVTLSAQRPTPLIDNMVRPDGKLWAYPTTYFPAGASFATATIISLRSGEERSIVAITLRPGPTALVSGTVIGPGGPVSYAVVNIVPAAVEDLAPTSAVGAEVAQAVTRSNGTFVALGVPAGEYAATVLKTPITSDVVGAARGAPAPAGEPVLWGRTSVSVGSTNVEHVTIQLMPGVTVSGRLSFEPGTATLPTGAVLTRTPVTIVPPDGRAGLRPRVAPVTADGSFASPAVVPSRYTIGTPIVPGWAVKSVTAGGRELPGRSIQVTRSVTDLVITYTDKAGELNGAVSRTASDLEIVALLAPLAAQSTSSYDLTRLRSVAVSGDGEFSFRDVLPGDYAVVVVASPPTTRTDALMASWFARGEKITLGDREKRSVRLSIIRR